MSILSRAYPSKKMDDICVHCRGNPKIFLKKNSCVLCKRTRTDWSKEGYATECDEMLYLKETWNKCKLFKQVSCGIPLMDRAMAHLFGMPHSLFGTEPIKKMPAKVAMHIPEYIQEVIGLEVL